MGLPRCHPVRSKVPGLHGFQELARPPGSVPPRVQRPGTKAAVFNIKMTRGNGRTARSCKRMRAAAPAYCNGHRPLVRRCRPAAAEREQRVQLGRQRPEPKVAQQGLARGCEQRLWPTATTTGPWSGTAGLLQQRASRDSHSHSALGGPGRLRKPQASVTAAQAVQAWALALPGLLASKKDARYCRCFGPVKA